MVSDAKKEQVKKVEELIQKYPIVGIVNLQNLPTAQLQRMRDKLRSDVEIFLTKKRLIKVALENLKDKYKGIEQLEEKMRGIPALLLTKENPFKLFNLLQKNKSQAAAKGGQEAPNDIKISAGPTPFAPGPIISELGAFGLKTGVEDGKVAIKDDAVVVKEGGVISNELASLLQKLGIEPMEIGLDLVAVYEDGQVFTKDILAIDEDEYLQNVIQGHKWAFNLSIEAGIMNDASAEFMIQKAFRDTKAVALEGNVLTSETTDEVLAKAERQATALKNQT